MSAAVAVAPSPAPHSHAHDRTGFDTSPAASAPMAPSSMSAPATSFSAPTQRISAVSVAAPAAILNATPIAAPASQLHPSRSGSGSPRGQQPQVHGHGAAKSSPPSASRSAGGPPRIMVKKEPGSPKLSNPSRPRPRRLDLSKNANSTSPATGRPLTARDAGALGIQEVGLACLSPGFITQDPVMKEQVQRSMSVRDHQRQLIEQRLHQQSTKGDVSMVEKDRDGANGFAAKTPGMSRRNKAPPGLSIVAPSHEQFASERVIQSAPLGQTFSGMSNPHPLTRHIDNRPSKLSNTSHIHHVPANQTNNRLPPISDVFGHNLSGHPGSLDHAMYAPHTAVSRSGGSPTSTQHPHPTHIGRPREYKSAEEAQHDLAGGRPELLPKLVHYGGHQPPTPPSPLPGVPRIDTNRSCSVNNKRRRDEFEADVSPPLGAGRPSVRKAPFGEGRDSSQRWQTRRVPSAL